MRRRGRTSTGVRLVAFGVAASVAAAAATIRPARAQSAAARPDAGASAGRPTQREKHADAGASGDSTKKKRKVFVARPLFASETPLALTLTADFGALAKERDTLKVRRYPATLSYADERGAPATLEVQLATRGHYRLRATTCRFPPLRVVFDRSKTKGTPFEGQRALKLVTHCRSGDRTYEQYVLREYLVYKVYNALTDRSFRDRLVRVTYAEPGRADRAVTAFGFLIESEEELAGRTGGQIVTVRRGSFDDLDPATTDLLAVFEYFIGNTDWSLAALHNIRIVKADTGGFFAVPYDFDWSGIVNTHYAVPDARLPIKSVHERLYRGPCRTAQQLAPTFDRFRARRDTILALYRNLPDLDRGYVKDNERYVNDFYETIGNANRWRNVIERSCGESN